MPKLDLEPLESLDLTPLDEEESDRGYERPPRGEMLEPGIPRPRYSLDEPVPGGKLIVNVEGRTVERLPASIPQPELGRPAIAPFTMEEFGPRTATAENPPGVATPEQRAFNAEQPSEFDRPVISAKTVESLLEHSPGAYQMLSALPLSPKAREVVEGFKGGVAEQVSGMTSQSSAAILPAFAIPYVGPALAMGMGAKAVGAGAGTAVAGLEADDPRAVGQGLSEVAGGGLMVTAPLMHGGITRPSIPPRITETIARTEAAVPGALSKSKAALADTAKREPMSDQIQQLEKPIEKGIPDEAIQVQEAQGPKDVLKSGISDAELKADIARYNEIQAELTKASETDPMAFFEGPLPREKEAIKNKYGGYVPVEPATKSSNKITPETQPERIVVQAEQDLGGGETMPGYVTIQSKGNAQSGPVEAWRAAGHEIPDTAGMPSGTYTVAELKARANEKAIPAATEAPTPAAAAQTPIRARQAPVVEPRVGAVPEDVPGAGAVELAKAGLNEFGKEYEQALGLGKELRTPQQNYVVEYVERFKRAADELKQAEAAGGQADIEAARHVLTGLAKSLRSMKKGKFNYGAIGGGRPSVVAALKEGKPVNAEAVDFWGMKLPEGYTKSGGVYSKAKPAQPLPEPAAQKSNAGVEPAAASQAVQLGVAESKLAEVVNQTIEQSSPTRLGVSPSATMRPVDVVLGAPDLRSISPAVEARWQQAVKGTEGIIEKVKTQAEEAWKSITREYADLPPREFPAEIDVLRRQRASPNASARTTVDVLKGITNNLGPKQYGVFNRVALLEDLVKDVESGKYATGNDLPFGYKNAGELTADLNKFRAVAESTPQIKAALERRQEFMDSMRGTLVERGFLPESVLSDPRYFHHQVLLYMAEKNAPAGSRSFRDWFSGWQKKRTGSSLDYNRQYVEAEAEVLADAFNKFTNQDLHGEMQGIADIAPQLKEVHGAEWRQHLPKGYTTWQPKRGNIFYQVQTVAERVMDRYLSGLGDILPSEFREALAVGGRRQEWVIPKPLAKVLDNISPRPDNWIGRLATTAQNSWKRYILLNPLRAAKYNLNNLSGDLDFLFAAQPKIFTEFKGAAPDMWGFHVKGKSAVGDIKEAMQDGVIGSGWRSSELPDIARSDYFNWLTGEKPKLVDRYWDWIGKRNDAREDTGRLASYRFAKKEWEAGRPFYGASVPADVNALATPRLKAAKVAREILIDYGRGTEFSNFTRQKLVPFFKWMEGNFVRYQQLIRNVPEHEGAGSRVAGVAGKKAATLGLRMAAAYGIVNLWNHMLFPKEEEELGEARNQLHLILGRDDQGNIQTIRFQGALSDLLGWVGGEDMPQDVKDLATGKASVGDKMEDAYEAGISRAVNASLPFPKTAAEIGLGRSFYPNVLQPRPVRDKAEHAAGLFSLKPVYQWLAGKPHKPLRHEIANLISYTTDPGEAAYNTTRHMAGEWLEDQGEERANVIPGKRSNALYYYKQALRYKDQATAKKFLDEYNRLGGSREGLTQSIKASAPLSMLGKQRGAFLDSLSPQEQEAVKRAEEWYRKVYER